QSKINKREKGIWQRRYWEHVIRDDADLARHVDYIHFNPVKHGLVSRVCDWSHSSFHQYVARGALPADWGGEPIMPGVPSESDEVGPARSAPLPTLRRMARARASIDFPQAGRRQLQQM